MKLAGSSLVQAITPMERGYTGHEMLPNLDVIQMGGRIYDPNLARFLQADPNIQAPTNLQNYNRYSYVLNSPLTYTDPSGYFFKSLLKGIMKLTGMWYAHQALNSVPILNSIVGIALNFIPGCQIWCTALHNGMSTFVATGSLNAGLKSGIISAAANYVGSVEGLTNTEQFFVSGVSGGVFAELQGGSFGNGFISAGVGVVGGMIAGNLGIQSKTGQIISSSVIGGTASQLTGGKFANGAITAAFSASIKGYKEFRSATEKEVIYARLADGVYEDSFEGTGKFLKQGQTYNDAKTGLKAALFVNSETGESVVAFAGTTGGVDWIENYNQAMGNGSSQYAAAKAYGELQMLKHSNIHFVGHSLGGGLASASAAWHNSSATVFNAAGLHSATIKGSSGGNVTHFYSGFDALKVVNGFTPVGVPGEQISLGIAGLHGMGSVCNKMGC